MCSVRDTTATEDISLISTTARFNRIIYFFHTIENNEEMFRLVKLDENNLCKRDYLLVVRHCYVWYSIVFYATAL